MRAQPSTPSASLGSVFWWLGALAVVAVVMHHPSESISRSSKSDAWHVVRVIDGDTLLARAPSGAEERVRVLWINTPETKKPRTQVQCFGREAAARAVTLLPRNSEITMLPPDDGQPDRDRYGRLLRSVLLADGTDFGLLMVREGFAWFHAMRRHQYSRRSLAYNDAEREARAHHRGLWHPRTCNGEQRPA